MSDTAPLAFDPRSLTEMQCEKQKADVLSCEACQMIKTPDPICALINFEANRAETCARLESNVIVERTQANVRQPAAQNGGETYHDESKD